MFIQLIEETTKDTIGLVYILFKEKFIEIARDIVFY